MTAPSAGEISAVLHTAMQVKANTTPRTVQSMAGIIGPSDLGFCHNKAALMTKGVERSDPKNYWWAASVGTAIHTWTAEAFAAAFPEWTVDNVRVTATFPSGASVTGTPDIIVPEWNMVLDVKSVDGFEKVKRFGVSLNHRYQRHTYALGAVQAGLLDDSKPIYVGNVYLDRSGEVPEPLVIIDEFDYALTDEIDQWITDVIYAVAHNEDASRDIAAPVCEKICEFFTACRGALPDTDDPTLITDEETKQAIALYVEGRDMKASGDRMMNQAKVALNGINGTDGQWQVRWTQTNGTDVPGYYREGGMRLDVRKRRG